MNSSIQVSNILPPSWKLIKSQIWILAGLLVGYLLISSIISIFLLPISDSIVGKLIGWIISILISAAFSYGYIKNMFQTIDNEEPQISAYKQPLKKLINMAVASICFSVIWGVGLCVFIIPGIYLALRLQFFGMFIVEENTNAIDSLKKSWALTKGKVEPLLILALIEILIIIIGFILLGIGIFIAFPLVSMMACYTYRILAKDNAVATVE